MKFSEFKNIAVTIKTIYPTLKAFDTEEGIGIWFKLLNDLDYRTVSKAVASYAKESPYPPTIADLRRYSAVITGTDWSVAWNKLKAGAKLCEVDYAGQYAFSTIGSYVFENSADLRVMQEFKKLYLEFDLLNQNVKRDLFCAGMIVWMKADLKKLGLCEENKDD